MIAIDLGKQHALDADPRRVQQLLLLRIEIEQEIKQCFSLLLKKQKKLF